MNDTRKKKCPNEKCDFNLKDKVFSNNVNYCPNCGSKLIFVCKKCHKEIEDLGPEHALCNRCIADKTAKKQKVEDKVKNTTEKIVGIAVGAVVFPVVAGAKKIAKDKGGEIGNAIKDVAINALKKK